MLLLSSVSLHERFTLTRKMIHSNAATLYDAQIEAVQMCFGFNMKWAAVLHNPAEIGQSICCSKSFFGLALRCPVTNLPITNAVSNIDYIPGDVVWDLVSWRNSAPRLYCEKDSITGRLKEIHRLDPVNRQILPKNLVRNAFAQNLINKFTVS